MKFAPLDTGGKSVRADAMLTKFLQTQRGQRLLIATLDDLAAVYAKNAIELTWLTMTQSLCRRFISMAFFA